MSSKEELGNVLSRLSKVTPLLELENLTQEEEDEIKSWISDALWCITAMAAETGYDKLCEASALRRGRQAAANLAGW